MTELKPHKLTQIDTARQYLIDYLTEEFDLSRGYNVRVVALVEDECVMVRTETREYYFPFSWADHMDFTKVQNLVQKIKDFLE